MTDYESQKDEMYVLESIYNAEEFKFHEGDGQISGHFSAFFQLPGDFTIIYRDIYKDEPAQRVKVKHLPPVSLYFKLPADYPSKYPPEYEIACPFAPNYMVAKLIHQLDHLWRENEGSVILYIWMNFLKENTLSHLGIENSHDVSKKYTAQLYHRRGPNRSFGETEKSYSDPDRMKRSPNSFQSSRRNPIIQSLPSNMNIVEYLVRYDEDRIKTEFHRNVFSCGICFMNKVGFKCFEFKPCEHVYCKDCIREYFEHRIKDRSVTSMPCPYDKCKSEALQSDIRELLGPTLYAHYDQLLLSVTLDTMPDITYCPRLGCQLPVMREADESMAVCTSCHFAFCIYCKMTYHGVEPCKINSNEKRALIQEYIGADDEMKKKLERRYGKKQIMTLVQCSLSESWISENSKPCPNCSAAIEKSHGCNKMSCWKCCTYFCWLCGTTLSKSMPYNHYSDPLSRCAGLLFQGVIIEEDFDEDVEFYQEEDLVE